MKVGGRTGSAGPFLVTNGELQKHISELKFEIESLRELNEAVHTCYPGPSGTEAGGSKVQDCLWLKVSLRPA